MKFSIAIFGLLILIGCNSKEPDKQVIDNSHEIIDTVVQNEPNRFSEFKNLLPKHQLPFSLHCGLKSLTELEDYQKYSEFIPEGMEGIYGLFNAKTTTDLILYGRVGDDLYPYLYSYDNNGKILDSLFLILNFCGGADEFSIPSSYAFIEEDGLITMIDTTFYIHYTGDFDYDVDSMRVTTVKVKLDNNGEFKEISTVENKHFN